MTELLFTKENYMKLKQAYASGVSEVEFDDRKIKYNSPKDMERILYRMEIELGLNKKNTMKQAIYNKGL